MMYMFICIFLPALITFRSEDSKKSKIELLKQYAYYTVLINIIVLLTVLCIRHYIPNFDEFFTFKFTLKYLSLSFVLSYFLPFFVNFMKKNFGLKIIREKKGIKHEKVKKLSKKTKTN